MKKIMLFVLVLFLSVMWLSGCDEDKKSKGCLTGYYDDFYGTWERKSTGTGDFTLVLTIGDSATTYYYCFFDSYKTLRLRAENSEGYTYYGKQ